MIYYDVFFKFLLTLSFTWTPFPDIHVCKNLQKKLASMNLPVLVLRSVFCVLCINPSCHGCNSVSVTRLVWCINNLIIVGFLSHGENDLSALYQTCLKVVWMKSYYTIFIFIILSSSYNKMSPIPPRSVCASKGSSFHITQVSCIVQHNSLPNQP